MISLTNIKEGTFSAYDFNLPLNQLNSGKEDRLPLPSNNSMVLTSDTNGNKSWTNLLKIGLTADDAFRADYGMIAYNHSQSSHNYLKLTGGTLTGDITLGTNAILVSGGSISVVDGNFKISSGGSVDITSTTGLKLNTQSFITSTPTSTDIQVNGNKLTVTNSTFGSGPLVLSTDKTSIDIYENVSTRDLTATNVTVGSNSLSTDGLWINGQNVITATGSISGANIDFTPDYESGWMYVTTDTEVTVPHGIGFIPRLVQLTFATSNNPTTVYTIPYHSYSSTYYLWYYYYNNDRNYVASTYIESMNVNNFRYKTGNAGVFHKDGTDYTSGYVKVMLWK